MDKDGGAMYVTDITIHIEETLDAERMEELERILCEEYGVENAWVQDKERRLMMVEFDAEEVAPSAIVRSIRRQGLHARPFGL
jgi:hypothetical protein